MGNQTKEMAKKGQWLNGLLKGKKNNHFKNLKKIQEVIPPNKFNKEE